MPKDDLGKETSQVHILVKWNKNPTCFLHNVCSLRWTNRDVVPIWKKSPRPPYLHSLATPSKCYTFVGSPHQWQLYAPPQVFAISGTLDFQEISSWILESNGHKCKFIQVNYSGSDRFEITGWQKLNGLEISPSRKQSRFDIDALFVKSYLQEHSSDEM